MIHNQFTKKNGRYICGYVNYLPEYPFVSDIDLFYKNYLVPSIHVHYF